MNTTDERDQFLEEIRHKKRVLQSEKGRLDAAKRTYKGAQDKQVIHQKNVFYQIVFYQISVFQSKIDWNFTVFLHENFGDAMILFLNTLSVIFSFEQFQQK